MGLSGIAGELGVERHTVERAVREATGMTFRRFRTELIKGKAVEVLIHAPAVSIKETGFLMGFKSESAFSRFFKRACGTCPTMFRQAKVLETVHDRNHAEARPLR
jgi:AraC-like DNA-binding protein